MFLQPNFTFNGKYSRDLGVSICTFDDDMFNNVAIDYTSEVEIEHNLIDYNPYFIENSTEADEVELNLLLYNPAEMMPLRIEDIDMQEIYNWLITDDFAPFISDDDLDIIYYFKVTKIQRMFTFNSMGYLKVTFKPYSQYAYKREVYEYTITNEISINIFNPSRKEYLPIIEITNLGNTSTINSIGDMQVIGLNTNEKVIIDNLMMLIQNNNGLSRFNCCNRRWIKLNPREKNTLNLNGNMKIKIICEFPIIK